MDKIPSRMVLLKQRCIFDFIFGTDKVENVCRQWPPIFDCIAFSCPHEQLGETVGLAAVLRDGATRHIQ